MNHSPQNSPFYRPFKVVLPYIIVSTLWILFSDSIVNKLFQEPDRITALSTYKGLGFVIVTGTMLYVLVRGHTTQLEASLNQFRALFDTMAQGVIYHDVQGFITLVNPAAEIILGRTLAELRGRAVTDLFQNAIGESGDLIPSDAFPGLIALRIGKPVNDIIIGVPNAQQQTRRWLVMNAVPEFQPGDNKPYQVYTTLTDITEQKRSEVALRESETSLRKSQAIAHVGHWAWDTRSNRLFWSDEMHRIFGINPETFDGDLDTVIAQAIHPDDRDMVIRANEDVLSGKNPIPMEYRVIWPDQSVHTIWAQPDEKVTDENGRIVRLSGIVQDMTARKQAEAALLESEARYHHILNSMMEGCQIIDFEWRYVYVNDTVARQGRYAPEQLLGHTMMEMYPGIENTDLFAILQRCMEERLPERVENQFIFPDGNVGWFELSIQPAHEGIFILSTDITERKRAELALQEARDHLEQRVKERTAEVQDLYDNAPAGYHSLDAHGIFVSINQTELDWLGYRREEVIGKMNFSEIVTRESQEVFAQQFPLFKQRGYINNMEFELIRKDSTILPVAVNATAIYDADGHYLMSRSTVFDITERRKTEAQLRTANAELIRAANMKDEFLSSMSHELRTPLNGILSLSEALEEGVYGDLSHRQLDAVHVIAESGHHLLALINDILDLSKIEAGKMEIQPGVVKVDEICQVCLRLVRSPAYQKGLQVHYTVNSVLETVWADERRLKQMLVNLLGNAVKFTPQGGQIGLEVTTDQNANLIRFTVWDTGIGIAAANIPLLFQPFAQLDSSLARQYSGSGLGLSLVRRLAELHRGRVGVESEPGKGSRFYVELPLAAAIPTDTPPRPVIPERPLRPVQEATALIVEDSQTAVAQLTRYLHDLQVRVIIENDGTKVLEQVLQQQPDIILLDLLMPGRSGWDILDALKADARTQAIPVIVVSIVDEEVRSLAAGAAEHLVKPVSREQFYEAVQRVLGPLPEPVSLNRDFVPALSQVTENNSEPVLLLAEDNLVNQQSLNEYLHAKGYQVIVAANGLEAIEQALQFKPALILMDIQMPQMDGLEATRRLRARPEFAHTPIIALTALAMPGDRERCLEAGASDYLTKPVSLKALTQMIETFWPNNKER